LIQKKKDLRLTRLSSW